MTKSTINISMNTQVIQAIKAVYPTLNKAVVNKQESLRINTSQMQIIFDAAVKANNKEQFDQVSRRFYNLYKDAIPGLEETENFKSLPENEREEIRLGMMTQAKVLDSLINTITQDKVNLDLMRTAVAKAVGSFLFMLHNGDIEKVGNDMETMKGIAGYGAKEFSQTVQGWETFIVRKDGGADVN